jgi:putative FmdB family regulatory protein
VPTYQYACTECGEQLEAVQSFSDPALTECPNCGGKLRKVFNSVGIVFKGSGFYRNDSRAGNVGAEKSAAPAAESKSDSSSSTPAATPAAAGASSSSSGSSSSGSSSSGSGSSGNGSSGSSAAKTATSSS